MNLKDRVSSATSSRRRRPARSARRAPARRARRRARGRITAATSAVASGTPAHSSTSRGRLGVGPPRQLGREVGDRRLVGLDRAEAGQVDAPRGRPVRRRVACRAAARRTGTCSGAPPPARRACSPARARPARASARRAMSARSASSTSGAAAHCGQLGDGQARLLGGQLERVGVVEQLAGEVEHAQAAQHRGLALGPAQPHGDDRAARVHRRRDADPLAPVDRHPVPQRPAAGSRPRASPA